MHVNGGQQPAASHGEPAITMATTRQVVGASFVVRAPRGWVDESGFARDGAGLPLATLDGCGRLNHSSSLARTPPRSAIVTESNLVALTSKWSYKFFHWTIEALPRLALVHSDLMSGASLLTSCKGGLAKGSLALVGVSERQVVCWRPGRTYRSGSDLLWPEPSPCGGVRHAAAQMLRQRALLRPLRPLRHLPPVGAPDSVLLYQRHRHRRLVDHDGTLTSLVGAYGQSTVHVVDGSGALHEQVSLYRRARCQVGPHGAGLAMMLFAPNGFGTAEVTPGAYFVAIKGKPGFDGNMHLNRNRNRTGRGVSNPTPNACFRGLAASLGQRHVWLVVTGATANDDLKVGGPAVVSLSQSVCGASS